MCGGLFDVLMLSDPAMDFAAESIGGNPAARAGWIAPANWLTTSDTNIITRIQKRNALDNCERFMMSSVLKKFKYAPAPVNGYQ
jgi:hypothetical protein